MAQDGSRPNFFVILGLDPRAPWDERAYVSALDENKRQWSKQRSSGVKTHRATVDAQRNLALIRDIERVMRDPAAREAERKAAVASAADELRQRAARVADRVELMLAKGFLYDVEYEDLKGDLPIADEAVRSRAESADKRPVRQARKDNERLDQATERNLRANLEILGETDLYAVLRSVDPEVGSASSPSRLSAAADKLYQKARNTADKSPPEVGARQTLVGIAKKVFSSDELMRRYELSMLLAPLEAILERYERDLAPVRAIDSRQFEMFLREAAELGIEVALAKEVFTEYFRERNWLVEVPGAPAEAALKALVSCPRCAELNDPGTKHCVKCGSSLITSCPRCDAQVSVAAGACQKCGFRLGDRLYVEFLADEAGASLARDDVVNAADFLHRAGQAWPLGPDSDDPLAVRIGQLREQLEPVLKRQQKAIEQVSSLMDSRSFRSARQRLRSLPSSIPAADEMLQRCEDAIGESRRRVREARKSGVPDQRKAALYLEALDFCSDNSEARRELEQLPPAPPRRLRVETDEERRVVRLAWDPASDVGCSSVVIRADGPVPPSSAQGYRRHVVRTRGSWEDHDPLIGRPMWYAVYTERDVSGTLSEQPEMAAEPVLLTAEPQLTAWPGNNEVKLTWTVPENADRVEIQREDIASGNQVRFPPAEHGVTRRVDGNARNGTPYRYTARAVYTYHVPGQPPVTRYSKESSRKVTPEPPPAPPAPVRARGYPPPSHMPMYLQRVKLDWEQTERGQVRIVRSLPGGPVPDRGADFPEADLGRYGEVLPENRDEYIWMPGRHQACYFTPVLVLNGRCYAGKARPYAVGPEVGDVRAEQAGTSVIVTWTWPSGVDEALVAWDYGNEVADPVEARLQTRVRRADGAVSGEYDIPAGSARRTFVQVAAILRDAGAEFYTSGVGATAHHRVINLAYNVRRGHGQRGRLTLRPDVPAHLPALVLFGRTDGNPATRNDRPVQRIPPGHADPDTAVDMHLDRGIQPGSCRLFAEDDTDAGGINIVHPR